MIAAIEEAIKRRIAEAKLPYLRTVATYGGQFDAELGGVVRSFPAVWVALQGEGEPKPTDTTREVWHVPATWLVMAGARALQSEAASRKGGINIGTYQMLADLRALLLQQDFGLPVKELRPGRTRSLYNGKLRNLGVSIYAQEWHTIYPLEVRKAGRVPRYPDLSGAVPPGDGSDAGAGKAPAYAPGPDGTTLPPLPPVAELYRVGLSYYLRPPASEEDEPDMQDVLTMQGGNDV
jgi:phage gp37-like protein